VTLSGFGIFGVPLIGGSVTLDQSGNVYLGGGAGYRGQSLMAGWLARPDYSQQSVERLITGVSLTGTAGGGGFGGGVTVSSSCHAVELGVTSGAGFSGTFGYKAGNVLDWLGF
jgi:hypothetical protein